MSNKRKQNTHITDFFFKKTKTEEVKVAASTASAASGSAFNRKVYTKDMLPDIICDGKFRVKYDKKRATKGISVVDVNAKSYNNSQNMFV